SSISTAAGGTRWRSPTPSRTTSRWEHASTCRSGACTPPVACTTTSGRRGCSHRNAARPSEVRYEQGNPRQGRRRRHGVHSLRRALVFLGGGPAGRRDQGTVRLHLGRQGRRGGVLAGRAGRRPVRAHVEQGAGAGLQAGDASGELLCDGLRGVPQRLLRGGLRRLRPGGRGRGGETAGFRLLRPVALRPAG